MRADHQMLVQHAFQRANGGFQLAQAMIADCQTEIYAARSMVLETARKRDRGEDVVLEASMCKYFASEMSGRVADRCVQMFGGAGYVADHSSIERWYRECDCSVCTKAPARSINSILRGFSCKTQREMAPEDRTEILRGR